jgi:hypothetical protein
VNAERLHAIAASLAADLRATKTVETLGSLGEALENQVNQPNQPQHQESVATHWRTLQEALERSATNSYSPAWLQSLQELGAYDLTGARLAERIDEVSLAIR